MSQETAQEKARRLLLENINLFRRQHEKPKRALKNVPVSDLERGCPFKVTNWPQTRKFFSGVSILLHVSVSKGCLSVSYNFQKWTVAECQEVLGKLQFEFEICSGCTSRKCWNRLSLEEAEEGDDRAEDFQNHPSTEEAEGLGDDVLLSPTRAAALFEEMF